MQHVYTCEKHKKKKLKYDKNVKQLCSFGTVKLNLSKILS